MPDVVMQINLAVIMASALYLLWEPRYEEGIVRHFALGGIAALSAIGLYLSWCDPEALYCHPLLKTLLSGVALQLGWSAFKLWRAGERRSADRRRWQRLYQQLRRHLS